VPARPRTKPTPTRGFPSRTVAPFGSCDNPSAPISRCRLWPRWLRSWLRRDCLGAHLLRLPQCAPRCLTSSLPRMARPGGAVSGRRHDRQPARRRPCRVVQVQAVPPSWCFASSSSSRCRLVYADRYCGLAGDSPADGVASGSWKAVRPADDNGSRISSSEGASARSAADPRRLVMRRATAVDYLHGPGRADFRRLAWESPSINSS
jgi:hypothetical protein